MNPNLDRMFLRGKLSEDEYCALALNDGEVVAIAIDMLDRITTVSMSLSPKGYFGEVLYSPEDDSKSDEKFFKEEKTFKEAKAKFLDRVKRLEKTGNHEFEITWIKEKTKDS